VPSEYAKGRDDDVPDLHSADVGADGLDDADELVPHTLAGRALLQLVVRPEVAAADAGAGDADKCIRRLRKGGVGDVLDADVAGAVHDCCSHATTEAGADGR
jgi:hypothetical protein